MAKHHVSFSIAERELSRADVEFIVKQDDAVLGTLAVVGVVPQGNQLRLQNGLDRLMREAAKRLANSACRSHQTPENRLLCAHSRALLGSSGWFSIRDCPGDS
jgi:hypothetical protein